VRRRLVAAAALGAVALAGAAAWVWWVPGYRPSLREGEAYAIDVSAHQGRIDWRAVARDGIGIAWIKATEGGDFTDDRFVANWEAAGDAGVRRGAYHFFTLCRPGEEQARHFLRTVNEDGEVPHAVDLELAGNCAARPSREDVARELAAFLGEVEEASHRPTVLYLGDDWRERYGLPTGDRPLWLRRVLRRPSGGWYAWQVQGRARVDGVEGPVDLDVVRVG
jgi:lysozyme